MNRYETLLNKAGISNYIITEKKQNSCELFFVKKNLDMRRMTDIETVNIAVFKDTEVNKETKRGRADIIVTPSMTDEEISEKIAAADFSASLAGNKFYEFPKLKAEDEIVVESNLNGRKLEDVAMDFVKAAYEADDDDEAFINSFEIFATESHVTITSFGQVKNSFVKRIVKGEFVAQCKKPTDVETYADFNYDSLELESIKELVKKTCKLTRDRAIASKMPKTGTYDVVISDKYVPEVINTYYLTKGEASSIFVGYSDWEIGKSVQGEDVKGAKVNIKIASTAPFSPEGIRMKERSFIGDGTLKMIHGNMRFCNYLGIEQTGSYNKVILPAGDMSMDDMLHRKCLYVVNFSDFQLDPFSGHFGGEMRLAYYFDGEGNCTPVTGGSINGDFLASQGNLTFSKETQKLLSYEGPKAILFKDVPVAGEN